MTVENSRQTKSLLTSINTSVGRFYEKRHQLDGALNEYSRAIINNDDISSYIGRARVHLKMGSIHSHQDTGNQQKEIISLSFYSLKYLDVALKLIGEMPQSSMLLYYNAYLEKAKIFYADSEFELGLVI